MPGTSERGGRARSGRAVRNDERIKAAARRVFVADPEAPISAVAQAAGMGISALYSRYDSKDALLRSISDDGLTAYIGAAEAALELDDPLDAFESFLGAVVEADTHSLTQRLAGTFEPTEGLRRRAEHGRELAGRLLAAAQQANGIRADLVVDDLSFILEQIAAVRLPDPQRTRTLRTRYLALTLDGLSAARPHRPLPTPEPSWTEIADRWQHPPSS